MARIAGVNIPTQKRVEIGLRYIHGIGPHTARKIITQLGIDPTRRVSDLTESEVILWVQESLGVDGVGAVYRAIDMQIQAKANPPIITPPLPWG